MTIRDISIEDYETLILFWKEHYFISEIDSKEKFRLFLEKNPHLSVLAEKDGEIVGSALGSFDGRRGYLQKVVVKKTLRNQGIGQQLVEAVLAKLKAVGATYIPISVDKNLVGFYENCGFKPTPQVAMKRESLKN